MYRPDILLLDESTSALDTQNKHIIEQMIFDMVKEGVESYGLRTVMTRV